VKKALAAEGAVVFAKACDLGLEGIVSKRAGSLYRTGVSSVDRVCASDYRWSTYSHVVLRRGWLTC